MTLDDLLIGVDASGSSLIGLGTVLLAGVVASAVCPCTLPVGLGVTSIVASRESQSHRSGLLIAAAFFTGIVINLTLLGALAGRLGAVLSEPFGRYWALTMALFSLVVAGVALWGPRMRVSQLSGLRRPGTVGAFGYGFIFSLGTSAAPLLVLLTVSAAQASHAQGAFLGLVFGIGRGLPFLMVGLFAGAVMRLARLSAWSGVLRMISAGALVVVGICYLHAFIILL